MADIHLYQIAYDEASRAAIGPGWKLLDNLDNPRPDWFEYWPIRRFLLAEPLDDAAWYGFFSPKFGHKTGFTHGSVRHWVGEADAAGADVVLMSPQPDMGAFFLNVFEQGETFDPGLIDAFGAFLASIGRSAPLRTMVMDSRQVVFSNYFAARPAFWREWLAINEALFAVCEGPDSPLKAALTAGTTYPGAAQRKVFLMERVASLLLATQPRWKVRAIDPFGTAWSASRLREHPSEAVISDALKIAFRDQGFPEYMQVYARVRQIFQAGS